MRHLKHLLFGVCLLSGSAAFAQAPSHPMYVKESGKASFYNAYKAWQPGTPLYSDAAEDEAFFISRVKPKQRFTNSQTQVDPEMTPERKLLWWCPVGTADGLGWKALPSYYFDSEVYSMWSYTDIYGYWTAPFIRMAGAFADVCHKNGVQTSVVAAIPYAANVNPNDNGHGANIQALIDGGAEKLLQYLRYYGIDGIGFNSEFSIADPMKTELKTFLGDVFEKKDAANWPNFTNAWYGWMTSAGSPGGTNELSDVNKDWFNYDGKATSDAYFMNYNWGASNLGISQTTAKSFPGRSSYDVYGGMDFQGRSVADWLALKNAEISVGLWGAHNMNMMFEGRGELGSEPTTKQKAYQLISENVFTGSSYNPVNTPEISNILKHTSRATDFHGFSSFITARSVLATDDLAKEPFVTYFNLGNGKFFNVDGVRSFDNQWYNIGMQDYLPTWRWWFTSDFMGRTADKVPAKGLKAEFSWDDAWFGGSCLSISGGTELEYLQMFKTKYPLMADDVLTIRYKVTNGTGSISWACSADGSEDTEVSAVIATDASTSDKWVEKQVKVGTRAGTLRMADKTLAMMGLKFIDTSSNFQILIGEVSLTRAAAVTPAKPTILSSSLKGCNYKGLDFKLFFKMKDASSPAEPVYNEDVDTWFYKIYVKQAGGEKVLCTATTSWAAYVVSAPYDIEGEKTIQLGVSAVALDGKSESEITWTEPLEIPKSEVVEGIEIDKTVIKANEEFTVKFIDPTHVAADKWEILNAQNGKTIGEPITNATSITTELPEVGIYDLRMTYTLDGEKVEELYQALIQISPEEVGAIPQIKTLKANNSDESIKVNKDASVTYSYTGRSADGSVSRGLRLSEKAFGLPCAQLGFDDQSSFTISFWFNPAVFNHSNDGTQLLNIRSAKAYPGAIWYYSEWGYIWTQIGTNGKFQFNIRKPGNTQTTLNAEDFTFVPNQWYHMAVVVGYTGVGRDVALYVNGQLVGRDPAINQLDTWDSDYSIMIGGIAQSRAGFDGYLDEFQLYNKALSAEEVKKSMEHQTEIPESLIGYWDFETDANAENKIYSIGSNKKLEAFVNEKSGTEYVPLQMTFAPGAPFIAGTNYKIETLPTWNIRGAELTNTTGSDETGSVTATYAKEGTYSATLTLSNGWGSDTKTFEFVTVEGGGLGIEDDQLEAAFSAYPNPFIEEVHVRFANEGVYDIEVFDIAGKMFSAQQVKASAGEYVNIAVNGASGTYFIKIKEGNKTMKALKVIKK